LASALSFFHDGIAVMAIPQTMRKQWSFEEVSQLRKLVRQNTPAKVIARKLGRTLDAVYVKASREGLSLRLVSTPHEVIRE
jgi:hypothetical protein